MLNKFVWKVSIWGKNDAQKAIATGESESMKLIAKGSSDARLIIAEKTMESLRVVSKAMEGICADPTQYLIGLQYIKMLTSLASKGTDVEVYMPLQTDIGAATSRM